MGMHGGMQTEAGAVEGRGAFRREDGNGRGYVAANQVDLSAWSPLLHAAGVTVADGSGRIEAWTQLRGHRVAAVTADVQLQDLWLQGAPLAKGETPPRIDVGGLQLQARWQQIDSGWRLAAPRLRIGGDRKSTRLN